MKSFSLIPVVAACFSIGLAGASYAQQRVSTEQAWATCLKKVDSAIPRSDKNDAERTAAFKACMAQLGHAGGG